MMQYNIHHTPTYETDDEYRSDLMSVLGVFDIDDIITRLVDMYKEVSCEALTPIFIHCAGILYSQDPEDGFLILFSYDYLKHFHVCMVDLIERGEIDALHLDTLKTIVQL